MKQLVIALRAALVLILLTGVVYPLLVTAVCQAPFRHEADGSMVAANGRVVGSELIGQRFTRPEYFHPRPSAAGAKGYDALASGGSNLGPTSRKLAERVAADIRAFRAANPAYTGPVPADLVTSSGSGLDPDISVRAAEAQVARVAAARHCSIAQVRRLVQENTAGRQFGIFGEPRVNVLRLNLALDTAVPAAK